MLVSGPHFEREPVGAPMAMTGVNGRIVLALPPGTYRVQDANDGERFLYDPEIAVEIEWTPEGPRPAEIHLERCEVPEDDEAPWEDDRP